MTDNTAPKPSAHDWVAEVKKHFVEIERQARREAEREEALKQEVLGPPKRHCWHTT